MYAKYIAFLKIYFQFITFDKNNSSETRIHIRIYFLTIKIIDVDFDEYRYLSL